MDGVFNPADGKEFSAHPHRQMVYGTLRDKEGRAIDQCMAVRFQAGRSYTGEDSGEFHCHGSPVVLGEGLDALFAAGARQAGRGEFTRRAFLNGKMDLTQAEAVIDLIESETAQAARSAVAQIGGALRRRIEGMYDSLMQLAAQFYAVVDYPDEDVEEITDMEGALASAEEGLRALLATAERGRVMRRGVPTAIIGRPNAGKSSLLNALVGYDRAIVTEVAGTTRDTVEEKAVVGGVLLRLIDTAGIRDAGDAVERLGVERAKEAASGAELLFAVVDGAQAPGDGDAEAVRLCASSGKPWVYVLSKRDLSKAAAVSVSSATGEGLEELEKAVAGLFPQGTAPAGEVLTNARQAEAVGRALEAVRRAMGALGGGLTPDAVLTDVEDALRALGELTGRTVREDLVDKIFERFCVGK